MGEQLFNTEDEQFSFKSHGVSISCERLNLPGYIAFHIAFSSDREELTLARAAGQNHPYFWTSIPEGRQKEAEGVGKLIEEYLSNKE